MGRYEGRTWEEEIALQCCPWLTGKHQCLQFFRLTLVRPNTVCKELYLFCFLNIKDFSVFSTKDVIRQVEDLHKAVTDDTCRIPLGTRCSTGMQSSKCMALIYFFWDMMLPLLVYLELQNTPKYLLLWFCAEQCHMCILGCKPLFRNAHNVKCWHKTLVFFWPSGNTYITTLIL